MSGRYGGGGGVVMLSSGVPGFTYAGRDYPLIYLGGTPQEPTIAGVVAREVQIDAGSDVDHGNILYTINASGANPDVEDSALASLRFANYTTNTDVEVTNIVGASGGATDAKGVPCKMIHIALAGGSSYTTAAGNIVTGTQMVLVQFAAALNVSLVEISIGTAYKGAGSNKRYRKLVITGFSN